MLYLATDVHGAAVYWCRQQGINPRSREVAILTRESDARGIRLQSGDVVKCVDTLEYSRQRSYCDLLYAMEILQVTRG